MNEPRGGIAQWLRSSLLEPFALDSSRSSATCLTLGLLPDLAVTQVLYLKNGSTYRRLGEFSKIIYVKHYHIFGL